MKSIVLMSALTLHAQAEPLSQGERDRALSHLHATRKMFLDSIAGLNTAQWNFKPDDKTWSVGEVAEHIAISEDTIFDLITKKIMAAPVAADKLELTKGKDEQVIKMIPDRTSKFQAPEFLRPTKRWPDQAALVAHFKQSRDRTINYVKTTQDDLRSHVAPHPVMKELDAYQWILLLSAHSERHTAQIKEVMSNPGFPK